MPTVMTFRLATKDSAVVVICSTHSLATNQQIAALGYQKVAKVIVLEGLHTCTAPAVTPTRHTAWGDLLPDADFFS